MTSEQKTEIYFKLRSKHIDALIHICMPHFNFFFNALFTCMLKVYRSKLFVYEPLVSIWVDPSRRC